MIKPLFFLLLFTGMSSMAQERYVDDLFEDVLKTTEVYAVKDGEALNLNIYTPAGDTLTDRPVIVFMHGGGFSGGSPLNPDEVKFAEMAAKKGYVVALISYRLTRKGKSFGCDFSAAGKVETFRKAADDFLDAVDFLITNAERLGIAPEKLVAGGSSAGAEAVLNAVYNHRLLFGAPLPDKLNFSGVFSLAGAMLDARYITDQNAVPGVFFHGTDDNLVPYATAPHHYCEQTAPGYLILDGPKTIARQLEALDSSYLMVSYQGAGHEISRIPFDQMPLVFDYFKRLFLEDKNIQALVQIPGSIIN